MATSGTLQLAIIGAGGISGAHASAIRSSEGKLALTAAVDPNKANLDKLLGGAPGAKGFGTVGEFLAARASGAVQAHAVIVCTPPSARIDIIEKCLAAGLHVLAEKPIAHTLADAKTLAGIASKYPKLITGVAYCHRFTPAVVKMRQLAGEGKIGRVSRFENCFATYFPALQERWMSDPALSGGGSFIDTGCHSLDLFKFLVGTPIMKACTKDFAWPGRGESSATAVVQAAPSGSTYPGVGGVILSGWMEPDRFTVSLVGTGGTLSYDYLKPNELLFTPTGGSPEVIDVVTHEARFANQLYALRDMVLAGARTDMCTFAEGVLIAEAVDATAR